MSLFNAKLLLVIGSACLMTACSGAEKVGDLQDKAAQVQDLANKAGQAKDLLANAGPLKDKVFGMKDGISQTLTSVKSGDFAAAQTSFGTLQTSWGEIEGDIKKLSGDTHAQIQSGMDTVEADLKAQSPDGTKIAANLESLTGSIGSLTGETADAKSTLDPSKTASTKGDTATGGGNLTDTSVASNLSAMKTALAETTTAVESADFATAKTTFADARQSWFNFGGSVKQTSADTYQSIDDGVKTVNGAINGAAPSADTLLTDLGSLSKSLDEVTP